MKILGRSLARQSARTVAALMAMVSLAIPAFGAVTGTVINKSTGQPQAGAVVVLNKLGQDGIEQIDQAKSDANGKFTINQPTDGPPHLLRTAFDGVTYNHMLPPGSPTTDLTVEVYNASKQPGGAKVSKHMLLFEPAGGQMVVNETFLYTNDGKTAWNDPGVGTLRFYMPAGGKAKVQVTAPGGMPIGAPVTKTPNADVWAVDYAVKPGDTRFDVTYTVPYTEGAAYSGKIVTKDDNTYLIAPNGVTMKADGLNDLGEEPRTKAHIYGFAGQSYKFELTGAPAAAPESDAAAGDQEQGPQIEQIMPRLYTKAIPILGIALGILALGFALLYRSHAPSTGKESDERGRS